MEKFTQNIHLVRSASLLSRAAFSLEKITLRKKTKQGARGHMEQMEREGPATQAARKKSAFGESSGRVSLPQLPTPPIQRRARNFEFAAAP